MKAGAVLVSIPPLPAPKILCRKLSYSDSAADPPPAGGTAMFALLALAGDLSGSIGPAIVGTVSQYAGSDLHAGILAGCVFPLVLVVCVAFLKRQKH